MNNSILSSQQCLGSTFLALHTIVCIFTGKHLPYHSRCVWVFIFNNWRSISACRLGLEQICSQGITECRRYYTTSESIAQFPIPRRSCIISNFVVLTGRHLKYVSNSGIKPRWSGNVPDSDNDSQTIGLSLS